MFNPTIKKTSNKVSLEITTLTSNVDTLFLKSPSLSQQFTLTQQLFTQLVNNNTPLTLVLQGYNIADGIGDFRNLMDYYLWCQAIFEHCPGVTLKAIAFVSKEKEALANKLKPTTLKDYAVIDIRKTRLQQPLAEEADVILVTGWGSANLSDAFEKIKQTVKQDPYLPNLLGQCDCLLNIATPFENSGNLLLDYLKPECLIYSVLEYAPTKVGDIVQENDHEYTERAMGIRPKDIGFKLNEALWERATKIKTAPNADTAVQALLSLKNQALLTALLASSVATKEGATAYLAQVNLGSGYLQSPLATERFIYLACQLAGDNRSVDLLIALSQFDESAVFLKKKLVSLGFTTLITLNHQGGVIKTLHLAGQGARVLRLIDFTGCSPEDAEVFSAVSFILGGSGDNSFSDVIATRAFPFFSLPSWKNEFLDNFIAYCQSHSQGQSELVDYLGLLNFFKRGTEQNTSDKLEALSTFAAEHFSAIQAQWNNVANNIQATKNAKVYFYEIMKDCLISRLMKQLNRETFLEVVEPLIEAKGIEPQSLVKLAIQVDALSLIQALVHRGKLGVDSINQKSARLHNKRGTTPLALAVLLNKEPLVHTLLDLGATPDSSSDGLFALALIKKINPSLIGLLVEHGYQIRRFPPTMLPLVSAFIQENPQLTLTIQSLMDMLEKEPQSLLYHAMRVDDKKAMKLAIALGATIEPTVTYQGLHHFAQLLYQQPALASEMKKSQQHCMTLLLYAAVENKDLEKATLAIRQGATLMLDTNLFQCLACDENTVFHTAVLNQDVAMMKLLLEAEALGANREKNLSKELLILLENSTKKTPVRLAKDLAKTGDNAMLEVLSPYLIEQRLFEKGIPLDELTIKHHGQIKLHFKDSQSALKGWHALDACKLAVDKPKNEKPETPNQYTILLTAHQLDILRNNHKLEINTKDLQEILEGENIDALITKFTIPKEHIQLNGKEAVFFCFNSPEDAAQFKKFVCDNFSISNAAVREFPIDNSIKIGVHNLFKINQAIDFNKEQLEKILAEEAFKALTSGVNFSKIEFEGMGDVPFNFQSLKEAALFKAQIETNCPEASVLLEGKSVKLQSKDLKMIADKLTGKATKKTVVVPVASPITYRSSFFAPANQTPNVVSAGPSSQEPPRDGKTVSPKFTGS